jgi:hypothetical protein
LIGQRWGLGGVAVCVSVAMSVEWLCMAQLSRSVTGLDWTRFVAVHVPGTLLALVIGVAAALSAGAARAGSLPTVPVLLLTLLGAATAGGFAAWLYPGIFLGSHGKWALTQVARLRRRGAPEGQVEPVKRESFE